ncbi:pak protein [Fusarium longipes]|uniref:Pak protein n=1 Tax=Fusarium longipes TaxID=694270 RepID=A0A395T0X5_9HYPO|nr:pak protein [Fusarium longipes]
MPYYSEYSDRSRRDTQAKLSPQANIGADMTSYYDVSPPTSQSPLDLDEYLVPAVDGPPSPERIRQLSKQMKHASHLNRGQRTASTGSSTFVTSERGWEQGFENMSITRHSSQRSTTTSGSSSKDRPDSVQVLGKNIFHRRAKSSKSGRARRESSAQSSAASSLYSTELGSETSLATFKDSIMPTIFARRKSSRDDAALQKKLQISGPFNFQHVTHTPRDQAANSASRTPAQELRLPNFSASSEHIPEPQVSPRSSRASALPRRYIKHARSQEQLRTSPPRPVRPPRSPPIEDLHSPTLGAPIPPPRGSSRQPRDVDALAMTGRDRPLTSGGFRHPQPFSPNDTREQPSTANYGYGVALGQEPLPVDDHRFSHAITTPDDAAWPLPATTNYEPPLPDVPEEEETMRSPKNASTRSSLRASQSVPLLRGPQTSENAATHRSAGHYKGNAVRIPSISESWEDDIDYCYEHEADANFEYEWERPSLDTGREEAPGFQLDLYGDDELRELPTVGTAESSPGMLSASHFDMPALSPASHASPESAYETAPSNIGMGVAVTNNFSLPRGEKGRRPPKINHSRNDSRASSFRESYGFTLSPSLLIPGDYHQQMLLNETEKQSYLLEDEVVRGIVDHDHLYEVASNAASHHSLQLSHQRASTSTTATNSTSLSDSTGERHVSTNSTWTNLTRLTSSTSLNKWVEQNDGVRESLIIKSHDDSEEEETTPPASIEKDIVPELTPFPSVPVIKKPHHKSHASESIVREEAPVNKSVEAIKTRRPRARTTSLSTQAPPVGQYALFPRAYAKGNGDRI